MINPYYGEDYCAPDSTIEEDAIRGKWVRVPRNLNREGNYVSGWLVSPTAYGCPSILNLISLEGIILP